MIRSFRNKDTDALFHGTVPRRFQSFARPALRKLLQLHAAQKLGDLAVFPGNRLEALKGKRRGQHSIRVNDQYRICFIWRDRDAEQVRSSTITELWSWGYSLYSSPYYRLWWRFFFRPRIPLTIAA